MPVSQKTMGIVLVLMVATALAGCGRKGDLERPGASANTAPAQQGITGGFARPAEEPEEEPVPERPFILDALI